MRRFLGESTQHHTVGQTTCNKTAIKTSTTKTEIYVSDSRDLQALGRERRASPRPLLTFLAGGRAADYQLNQDYQYEHSPSGYYAIFGRAVRAKIRGRQQYEFTQTLPENPFRVLKAPGGYSAQPDNEFPDQPVLQFWTWLTTLHVIRAEASDDDKRKIGECLCRCDIADSVGD
jgi:hypothetical protein